MSAKVRFFLPEYLIEVKPNNALPQVIREILRASGAEAEFHVWNGTIDGLPKDGPALVMAWANMGCTMKALSLECTRRGLTLFYQDLCFNAFGRKREPPALEKKTSRFVRKLKRRKQPQTD